VTSADLDALGPVFAADARVRFAYVFGSADLALISCSFS
jgi:hypothetical protein